MSGQVLALGITVLAVAVLFVVSFAVLWSAESEAVMILAGLVMIICVIVFVSSVNSVLSLREESCEQAGGSLVQTLCVSEDGRVLR